MDSLASLQVPAIGYGIRYEFGIFEQTIRDGWQVERTDKWLRYGNPWEVVRPEICYEVKFGGHTEQWKDDKGHYRVRWVPDNVVKGEAYDTPILGYRVGTFYIKPGWKRPRSCWKTWRKSRARNIPFQMNLCSIVSRRLGIPRKT